MEVLLAAMIDTVPTVDNIYAVTDAEQSRLNGTSNCTGCEDHRVENDSAMVIVTQGRARIVD